MNYFLDNLLASWRSSEFLAGALLVPLAIYSMICYRDWYRLGPGGIPHNFLGWLINAGMQIVARADTRTPAPWDADQERMRYGEAGYTSYLDQPNLGSRQNSENPSEQGVTWMRPRSGKRPRVPGTVAPQRQTTQKPSEDPKPRMEAYLVALAAANTRVLRIGPSGLEGSENEALWIAIKRNSGRYDSEGSDPKGKESALRLPSHMSRSKGEIAHVHRSGCSHMNLSLADAAQAIQLGWAERHRLSGVRGGVGWGYVMVYAPRDETEMAIWKKLVLASARFCVAAATGPEVVHTEVLEAAD